MPVSEIDFTTTMTVDPTFVIQPPVEIELVTAVVVTPPASSGGQPGVNIVLETVMSVEPAVVTDDITGEAHLELTASGETEADVEAVAVPVELADRFNNLRRVSITMPIPTLGRFGRPQ